MFPDRGTHNVAPVILLTILSTLHRPTPTDLVRVIDAHWSGDWRILLTPLEDAVADASWILHQQLATLANPLLDGPKDLAYEKLHISESLAVLRRYQHRGPYASLLAWHALE